MRQLYTASITYSFLDDSFREAAETFVDILEDEKQTINLTVLVTDEDGNECEFDFFAKGERYKNKGKAVR